MSMQLELNATTKMCMHAKITMYILQTCSQNTAIPATMERAQAVNLNAPRVRNPIIHIISMLTDSLQRHQVMYFLQERSFIVTEDPLETY